MAALLVQHCHLVSNVTLQASGAPTCHCHCKLSEEVDEVQSTRSQFEVQNEGGHNGTE